MPKTTRKTGRLTVDIYSLPASALPALIAAIPLEGDTSISISVEAPDDERTFEEAAVYRTGGPLDGGGPVVGEGMGPGSAPYVVDRDAITDQGSVQIPIPAPLRRRELGVTMSIAGLDPLAYGDHVTLTQDAIASVSRGLHH